MGLQGESHFLKEVDLEGERRRMLDDCTLRYHVYFEADMISRAACAALDHEVKQAMFSCDTELNRWRVLGFFCPKLLSLSELQFKLKLLAFNVSAEIDCMLFGRSPDFISFSRSVHVDAAAGRYLLSTWMIGRFAECNLKGRLSTVTGSLGPLGDNT